MLDENGKPVPKKQRPGSNAAFALHPRPTTPSSKGKALTLDATASPDDVESARQYMYAAIPKAIETLITIMLDEQARDGDRILAATRIIEYTLPRPRDTEADHRGLSDLIKTLGDSGPEVIDATPEAE